MRQSWLPEGKQNLFQAIRAKRAEVQARGVELIDLSIGEPRGPALLSARQAAAAAIMSEREEMHRYQYNDSPGVPGFAKSFVESNTGMSLDDPGVAFLPIPGIKRMLGLLPLACGCWRQPLTVATMTQPGYTFPEDWCDYLQVARYPLPLNPENTFRFQPGDIKEGARLVMVNYPHNPTGRVADRDYWEDLCRFCADRGIRLFNDAAYSILAHSKESCTLTEVAVDFPDLSWCEAFSAAKFVGNATGWQVGAVAGSPDFIGDLAAVKGNTDEGFVAAMAAGVKASVETDWEGIVSFRQMYKSRLDLLIDILTKKGLRLAVRPDAGFFTLWMAPSLAFGERMESAEQFNFLMMERTGIIGVHFEPSYVRYAVCEDIASRAGEIESAFEAAAVSYER